MAENHDEHRMGDAAGKMLRVLMAYVALIAFFGTAFTIALIPSGGFFWGGVTLAPLMVPYLVIRYRDPASTTLPFQRHLDGAIAR